VYLEVLADQVGLDVRVVDAGGLALEGIEQLRVGADNRADSMREGRKKRYHGRGFFGASGRLSASLGLSRLIVACATCTPEMRHAPSQMAAGSNSAWMFVAFKLPMASPGSPCW